MMELFIFFVVMIIGLWVISQKNNSQNRTGVSLESIKVLCDGTHTYSDFVILLGQPTQIKQAGDKMFLANWIRPNGMSISVVSFFDNQSEISINPGIHPITG